MPEPLVATVPSDDFVRKSSIKRIIDGDTMEMDIDLGFGATITHHIRLLGVDTPEMRGIESEAGLFVKKLVEEWIGEFKRATIHSKEFSLGRWGRCLCHLWVNGKCLNHWLLKQGLAWPTDGDGKLTVARDIWLLPGIPEDIRRRVAKRWQDARLDE